MFRLIESAGVVLHNTLGGVGQREDKSQIRVATQDILGNTVGGRTLSVVGGGEMRPRDLSSCLGLMFQLKEAKQRGNC